jgi:hypothetical protein
MPSSDAVLKIIAMRMLFARAKIPLSSQSSVNSNRGAAIRFFSFPPPFFRSNLPNKPI